MKTLFARLRVYSRLVFLVLLGRPYKLSLLVASGCNLHCQICSIWRTRSVPLTLESVRALWEAFPLKPCWINISGGEPTLNPQLEAILSYFAEKDRSLLITLTTNGFIDCSPLIGRVLARNRASLFYVSVSIDGFEADHDAARGRSRSFQNAWATYTRLDMARSRFPALTVGISTTVSRANFDRVVPFIRRISARCGALTVVLAQSSEYYRNSPGDGFARLPDEDLAGRLRQVQRTLPQFGLDAFLRLVFLEAAVDHLEGRYKPIPCASYKHNVLVTAELERVDCTLRFERQSAGATAGERVDAIAETLRNPRRWRAAVQRRIAESGCERTCHTPCEKYVHIVAGLLHPRHAPHLVWLYLRACIRSWLRRHAGEAADGVTDLREPSEVEPAVVVQESR